MDVYNFYGYPKYINKSIDWLPMDTEELYDKNWKNSKNRLLLVKYKWTKRSIKYKFNNYGFRCEDFEDVNNVVFLGCSHTIGIGIPIECSWTTLVSNEINLVPYNLGIGGGALDTCFRLASYWLEKLKPKIIILMEPDITRLEYKTNNAEWTQYKIGSLQKKDYTAKHYSILFRNMENFKIQRQKNILGIQELSKNINSKLVIVSHHYPKNMENVPTDSARDLVHPGKSINKAKAEEILKLI